MHNHFLLRNATKIEANYSRWYDFVNLLLLWLCFCSYSFDEFFIHKPFFMWLTLCHHLVVVVITALFSKVAFARRLRKGLLVYCHLFTCLPHTVKKLQCFTLLFLILNLKQGSCEYNFYYSLWFNPILVDVSVHLEKVLSTDCHVDINLEWSCFFSSSLSFQNIFTV